MNIEARPKLRYSYKKKYIASGIVWLSFVALQGVKKKENSRDTQFVIVLIFIGSSPILTLQVCFVGWSSHKVPLHHPRVVEPLRSRCNGNTFRMIGTKERYINVVTCHPNALFLNLSSSILIVHHGLIFL